MAIFKTGFEAWEDDNHSLLSNIKKIPTVVMLGLTGTDINSRKGVDYKSYSDYNKLQALDLNVYHVSTGLRLNIRGHELVTGLNYGFGYEKGRTQFLNLSDPVEFNQEEGKALQGTRQHNVTIMHNSISLYFGANLRFMN